MQTEDTYHHGNLRESLITEGLKMLTREGVESFSMRKLAQNLGVSHTAAYRHFADKEALLKEMLIYSASRFYTALSEATKEITNPAEKITALGTGYVLFFVKNPEMLTLFSLARTFKLTENDTLDNPFHLFRSIAEIGITKPEYKNLSETEILLGYWSKVHGLATLLVIQKEILLPKNDEDLERMITNIVRTSF